MSKSFRAYDPEQMFLMPPSMREWLPSGHLAYFISDVVDQLDLSAIMRRYTVEERGYPPYHPVMMVKVLLYAYCIGVPSSRKIARRLEEDIAFRVLAANNTPDFRKEHLKALAGLFLQVLKLCQKAGLVKLGHVSLDGSKKKANASKHKAMSYKRMKETEARLEAEVRELLQRAEVVAAELTNQPSDKGQAGPMMEAVKANTGQLPRQMSADAGYFSGEAVQALTSDGIDVYMPPDKMKHASTLPQAPRGRIPKGLSIVERMRRKLRTKKGRRCYGLRKGLSEPVFGQIKQARGFRQFLLRGKEKVKAEWRLICTGHNLLKLFGAWCQGLVRREVLEVATLA